MREWLVGRLALVCVSYELLLFALAIGIAYYRVPSELRDMWRLGENTFAQVQVRLSPLGWLFIVAPPAIFTLLWLWRRAG